MMVELIPGLPDEIGRECLIRLSYDWFSVSKAVCRRWKEEFASSEFHRHRKLSGFGRTIVVLTQAALSKSSVVNKLPVAPSYLLSLYEPDTGAWEHMIPVAEFSHGLPLFCEIAAVGRNLVLIGGWNPMTWEVSCRVFVYDFFSGSWRRGKDMPAARSFFACASDSSQGRLGTVFVAGGHDDCKNALASALAYDVASDEWISLPDMMSERDECKGVFSGGKFHVIGGYPTTTQGRFQQSRQSFDVDTWQWGQVQEDALEVGTCPRSCVTDETGKIYRCYSGKVMELDNSDVATWKAVAELPRDVRLGPYMVSWKKNKLLVGGSSSTSGPHSFYTLDLSDGGCGGQWKRLETPEEFSGHVQATCCIEI